MPILWGEGCVLCMYVCMYVYKKVYLKWIGTYKYLFNHFKPILTAPLRNTKQETFPRIPPPSCNARLLNSIFVWLLITTCRAMMYRMYFWLEKYAKIFYVFGIVLSHSFYFILFFELFCLHSLYSRMRHGSINVAFSLL